MGYTQTQGHGLCSCAQARASAILAGCLMLLEPAGHLVTPSSRVADIAPPVDNELVLTVAPSASGAFISIISYDHR